MQYLERWCTRVNQLAAWVAGGSLALMMFLSVFNIVFRAFGNPFGGTAEVVGWLAALTAALALGYTQLFRGHVAIDLLVRRFPERAQRLTDFGICLVSAALFAAAAWRTSVYADRIRAVGLLSETMHLPFFLFIYVVAGGLGLLSLTLLVDALKVLKGGSPK